MFLSCHVSVMDPKVCYFFLFAVTGSSLGGLVVAAILKRLDNIVKEYSGNFANVITAIFSSFLFPDKFQLTAYILTSLFLLLTGIYLYEMYKIPQSRPAVANKEHPEEEEDEIYEIVDPEREGLLQSQREG